MKEGTNLGEIIWKLIIKAYDVITYIWDLDYSFLTREYWGFTLIELLGIYLAFCVIRDVIRFIFSLSSTVIIKVFTQLLTILMRVGWTNFLKLARIFFMRVKATIRYLLHTSTITDWKERWVIRFERIIYSTFFKPE